jgi:hypothetical protein
MAMYHYVIGIVLTLLAVLHIVFAFRKAPAAIEPYIDMSSRRLRGLMGFVPAEFRVQATRLVVGLCLLAASGTIFIR